MGEKYGKGVAHDTRVFCRICGKPLKRHPIHDLYCEEHRYYADLDSESILKADWQDCYDLMKSLIRDSMSKCITAIKMIKKIPNGERTQKEQDKLYEWKIQYEYEKRYLTEFAGKPGRFTWDTMWLLITENEEQLKSRLKKSIRTVNRKQYYCWKNPITNHCFALEPVYGEGEEDVRIENEEAENCKN